MLARWGMPDGRIPDRESAEGPCPASWCLCQGSTPTVCPSGTSSGMDGSEFICMAWLGFDLCPGLPKFRIKVKLCLLLGEGLRLRDWLVNVEGIGLWPEPWRVLGATVNSTAFQQLRTVGMSVCVIAGHVCIACMQRWGTGVGNHLPSF